MPAPLLEVLMQSHNRNPSPDERRITISNSQPFPSHLIAKAEVDVFPLPLLFPEERIPRRHLTNWINQLIQQTEQCRSSCSFERLAIIFNQAALVFCLLQKYKHAELLCRKQIGLFINFARANESALIWILQPWINLGRLERINKSYNKAHMRFLQIAYIGKLSNDFSFDNFKFDKNLLLNEVKQHGQDNFCKLSSYLELSKLYIAQKNQIALNQMSENIFAETDHRFHALAYELLILNTINTNSVVKAQQYCVTAINTCPPFFTPMFYLRYLAFQLGGGNAKQQLMDQLVAYVECLTAPSENAAPVYFIIQLGKLLYHYHYVSEAEKVYTAGLKLAQQLGDEWYQIELLSMLARLSSEKKYSQDLKNQLLRTHYPTLIHKHAHQHLCQRPSSIDDLAHSLFTQLIEVTRNTYAK